MVGWDSTLDFWLEALGCWVKREGTARTFRGTGDCSGAGGRDVASYVSTTGRRITWWGLLFWPVGATRPWWLRNGLCGSCSWGGVFSWWCSDFEPSCLVDFIGGWGRLPGFFLELCRVSECSRPVLTTKQYITGSFGFELCRWQRLRCWRQSSSHACATANAHTSGGFRANPHLLVFMLFVFWFCNLD